jgi:SpoVK/Ycf46/Vps4 family AAA+-type ATPase
MNDVAGLAGLKEWLAKRKLIVADPDRAEAFGLSFPKGILLLAIPGCGKSLCAKSVAREWGLPLLRLDPANLYDRYMGDSEKNFRRALQTAERMAPVEFIRKGRFDEVFFVDLPSPEVRREILSIHLSPRSKQL